MLCRIHNIMHRIVLFFYSIANVSGAVNINSMRYISYHKNAN